MQSTRATAPSKVAHPHRRSICITACIAPKSERLAVRSIVDAKDRLMTVNNALPKASALDPQPVLGGVGDVSNRLYGILMIA
jgi:hypothetical protein